MKKKEVPVSGISRRGFLKGSAAGLAGLAAVGLSGCSASQTASTPPASSAAPEAPKAEAPAITQVVSDVNYEVINTDVIVIGSGFGGMSAAYEAIKYGRKVTMIDKGPFRHSGAAGFNWDVIATWCPDPDYYTQESYVADRNPVDRQAFYNADTTNPNADLGTTLINRGQTLPVRNEDGSVKWYLDLPMIKGAEGYFPRHDQDELNKSPWITIADRTMVTDLLVSEGRCLGVIGIYLPTGEMRVYRANSTIVATGGTCWMYGWSTVTAQTFNSPDNTGDVDVAAYRHGAGIGDAEFAAYDICSVYPKGLAYGWGTILNADANEWEMMMDKDGNPLFDPAVDDVERFSYDRSYFNPILAQKIASGLGTENGGILVDVSNAPLREAMKRNVEVFKRFGIDVFSEPIEAAPEMYEHGGTPTVDTNLMCEDIEGVFFVRGSGTVGKNGGSCVTLLHRFGSYAARCAIDYMKNAPDAPDVDWSVVEREYERLHEIRNREVADPLRPCEVRHHIQKACGESLGLYRETAKMETALEELRRIRKEEMPRMAAADKSPIYNTEWKEAVENYNLLEIAEISVQASLMREETRGAYLRAEFPELDDANWKCTLVAREKNGEIQFEKKTWPEADAWK